ncbi:dyslexia-associated protein KIAA0319 isoform X1 [Parasteatoda tepidariorum]|uniref:dyslexia-associated protein KIAA0319 isoform X1 n=1 Tax=Parasteatoda tepidariorum TaxID=114398 RepID=UPI001C71C5A4|nr:dyslexia-associated protein KIAA0319-like protein isoform X1 [Parasteatoda tepidariorum]XP_015923121.2 dyslexia-associated protein KIAA0319-like protein isoform X1 [Parasteatoda tepidariorum]
MKLRSLLTFVCFIGIFNLVIGDCNNFRFNKFSINPHSTPYGNQSAGTYMKVNEADNLSDCVEACCEDSDCNVAFLFNTDCFTLQCHNYKLCQPLKRKGKKFQISFVVIVRFPEETLYGDVMMDNENDNFPELNFEDVKDVQREPSNQNEGEDFKTVFKSCIFGLNTDCPEHEQCVPKNNRARSGFCECEDEYVRDAEGICKKKPLIRNHNRHITISPSITVSQATVSVKNVTDKSLTTTSSVHQLVVSAGDNVTLQLPENEVTLSAYAVQQLEGDTYKYEWTLISHPEGDETGTMQDQNTKNLKLSKLRAGLYTFKVTVSSENAVGEAMVNVTVLPPERENKPPIAIIQPSNVTVKLPNKDTVLDGSFSTDDDKIVKYQWEVLEVPIGYSVQLNETPTLQLKNLIPGLYRFKLNVTDSKGASNFTFANVTVQKETDYPPTANAKSEVVIYLPQNEVTLNGNLSTDDKGIKTWEWKKSPDTDKAVDMEGTNGPYLHLSQLEVGVYKFILKVTDTADQTSTTEVHLFVKPESNAPPVANAGSDQKVTLPIKEPFILNGTASKDDIKIVKWKWEQVSGPKAAILVDDDTAVSKVTGLIPGYYQFMLTVYDEKNLHASATINVSVIQTENLPPRANGGGDKTIYLPCDVVVMNGTASSDDYGIVKYQWTRDASSLAAGSVIEDSDETAVLKLSGLIAGRYLFRLTVSDLQGASSSDTASLIVKPSKTLLDHVELMVNADIKSFTQEQEDTLLRQLEILLHEADPIKVNLIKLDSDRHSRRVILIFTVERISNLNSGLITGVDVVARLKKKLRTDSSLLDVQVLSIDTVVCQNKCSGHGSCDQYTKHCVCEAFWMQDIFRYNFGDKESNCDWSILYVIIVSFTIIVTLAGILWSVVCCFSRMRFRRPKKRHRYTLLDDFNDREREREKFFPQSQKNSLMISDSESDAIFESQSLPLSVKSNGILNGVNRDSHNITA